MDDDFIIVYDDPKTLPPGVLYIGRVLPTLTDDDLYTDEEMTLKEADGSQGNPYETLHEALEHIHAFDEVTPTDNWEIRLVSEEPITMVIGESEHLRLTNYMRLFNNAADVLVVNIPGTTNIGGTLKEIKIDPPLKPSWVNVDPGTGVVSGPEIENPIKRERCRYCNRTHSSNFCPRMGRSKNFMAKKRRR